MELKSSDRLVLANLLLLKIWLGSTVAFGSPGSCIQYYLLLSCTNIEKFSSVEPVNCFVSDTAAFAGKDLN